MKTETVKVLGICAHCKKYVEAYTVGVHTMPASITGYLSEKVCIHNKCLKPWLKGKTCRSK